MLHTICTQKKKAMASRFKRVIAVRFRAFTRPPIRVVLRTVFHSHALSRHVSLSISVPRCFQPPPPPPPSRLLTQHTLTHTHKRALCMRSSTRTVLKFHQHQATAIYLSILQCAASESVNEYERFCALRK